MIPIPSGVRVWIATGHTDMRRGMQSLALTVQESLKRDLMPAISIFSGVATAIWSRFYGMTG
jgi:transposase